LAVRLAALPRMVTTVAATLVSVWLVATAFARAAAVALPDSLPAPQLAVDAAAAGTVLLLGGLWSWLDPVLVRAGFGAWARFALTAVGCLVSALCVTALPAAFLAVYPKPIAVSNHDALTVLAASLVLPLAAWVPGFWAGELVGRLWREGRRRDPVSPSGPSTGACPPSPGPR
jgi:hypothetical protein